MPRPPRPRAARALALLLAATTGAAADSLIELYQDMEQGGGEQPPPIEPPAAAARRLALELRGVAHDDGTLRVFVYDDAQAWAAYDYTAAVGYAGIAARHGNLEATVAVSGAGPWAVFVFHDADDDAELDAARGLPLEGFGHSGATNPYFAPDFATAARGAGPIVVDLTYPGARRR